MAKRIFTWERDWHSLGRELVVAAGSLSPFDILIFWYFVVGWYIIIVVIISISTIVATSEASGQNMFGRNSPAVRPETFSQPSCFSCTDIQISIIKRGQVSTAKEYQSAKGIWSASAHEYWQICVSIFANICLNVCQNLSQHISHLLRSQYLSSFFSPGLLGTPWPLVSMFIDVFFLDYTCER